MYKGFQYSVIKKGGPVRSCFYSRAGRISGFDEPSMWKQYGVEWRHIEFNEVVGNPPGAPRSNTLLPHNILSSQRFPFPNPPLLPSIRPFYNTIRSTHTYLHTNTHLYEGNSISIVSFPTPLYRLFITYNPLMYRLFLQ